MKNEFGHDIIEENVIPFPGQAPAPAQAPTGKVNEFGHPIVEDESDHGLKLVTGAKTAPDKAGKVLNLSSITGVPSPVVNLDPDKHEESLNLSWGMKAAERNPHIRGYINNVPLAASVSKNDWNELDEFSLQLEKLRPKGERQGGIVQAFMDLPETVSLLGSPEGRTKLIDGLIQLPIELVKGIIDVAKTPGNVAQGTTDLSTREGLDAAINMGLFVALGGAGKPRGGGMGRDIRVGDVTKSTPAEMEAFFGRLRGIKTKEEIDAFIAEKTAGIEQPQLMIEHAQRSAENLKEAVGRVNETKTKEISPEAVERFAEQHGDLGTVHIPAHTILDLYRGAGKVPIKGDGLFGFIPKLAEKIQIGAETGTEIAVPISKYVANVDPALHSKVADFIRVHQDGVTLEEAEIIKLEEKARKELEKTQEPETIVSAAVRTKDGQVYTGPNHAQALDAVSTAFKKSSIIDLIDTTNEGMGLFVTSTGRVVDRNEAHSIADKASQISPEGLERNIRSRTDDKSRLLAEDLQDALKPIPEMGKTGAEKHKAIIANTTIDAQGKARKSLYLDPLFTVGSDIAITQPEFAKYSALIDRANETILQKAVDLAEREVKKRQSAEWKSNESLVRGEVLGELHERPDVKLDRFLRTGSLQPDRGNKFPGDIPKLDRAWVEGIAGKGALERFTRDKDFADPQMISEMFGFPSKEEMVRQLAALDKDRAGLGLQPKEYLTELAQEETAKRMEARFGQLETNIALEASEIALADWNVDLLSAEWRMLAELAGKEPPLQRREMTKWVKDQFDKAEVSQVSYETFRRGSEKAGREAEKNLLSKKYDEAFLSKQTQMLNFLLAKEAKVFEKEQGKNERLMDKYTGDANLKAVDQAFTDQIHALMLQYGVRIRRTAENVEHNLEGKQLGTFIAEQQAQLGPGTLVDPPQLPLTGKIEDFTVNQYRDFAALLKNLDHVGRNVKRIEIGERREDYFKVVDEITKNLDVLEKQGFDPEAKGAYSKLRMAGRYVDSKLLKAETLINWMDLNDPMGAFSQTVHRGLIEGQYKIGFMLNKIAKLVKDLPNDRAWGKALNELTENTELLDWETREPLKLTNENKVAIALNYGNESSRRVMLLGHKWTEGEVEAYLEKTMTPMDWKVVKGIHGLFAPLAPLVEEATRKRSGLAVPLVGAKPFLESEGGYYPLMQNPMDVLIKAKQQTDLFQSTKFNPLPMAPAMHQRTGAVYKLDFSLERLHSVIAQTTHAVYMQEPVVNANKVIKDPLVREGIVKAFGPEYVEMLDRWIEDIANNGGQNNDMWASWLSRNLRESVVTALMGWKASTALLHGGSAGAASLYELGKMHLAEKGPKAFVLAPTELVKNMKNLGLGQFLPEVTRRFFSSDTQMWATIDEVMAESQELPLRVRTLQKDFGFQLDKIFNKNLVDDAMMLRAYHNTYAMMLVGYLDQLTATPIYVAAKAKALADGYENADAIALADKAVREAHGSASLVSRANAGRGEVNKWLTIAYNGYWNHNYNKTRQVQFEALSYERYKQLDDAGIKQYTAGQRAALTGAWITAMFLSGAILHHALRGEVAETDEGAVLGALASQAAGMFPLVNTMMFSILHNRDPSISPIEEAMRIPLRSFRDLTKEEPKHPIKDIAKITGIFTGVPSNQVIDLATAISEVSEGKTTPEGPGDWAKLIVRGPRALEEKR